VYDVTAPINVSQSQSSPLASHRFTQFLLGRFAALFADSKVSFSVTLPDGSVRPFGREPPRFKIILRNARAVRVLASIDEGRFGDAYVAGDIDLDGDMLAPFELRGSLNDIHPVAAVWRFLQPLLFGQVHTNKNAITAHYDIDPEFFLSLLDPKVPCYTQGIYVDADETLEAATLRKFDYCYQQCRLKSGDSILEIGPGWGAWFEYASQRGVKCTGITISQTSVDYLAAKAKSLGFEWDLHLCDLLEYSTAQKYDAIVIMGVIEHLPNYARVLDKFQALLRPGGRIFLDGSACTRKYELSSYMVKYIYGGNHSFLVLHDFLDKLARTRLEVTEIFNDRYSYFLTFKQWAQNFDRNREFVIQRFGEFNYRRFRLYLWGAAYEFQSRSLDCYRMIIQSAPKAAV
jgi:cyclopropane-fatty-acyl-phospholipid synthase